MRTIGAVVLSVALTSPTLAQYELVRAFIVNDSILAVAQVSVAMKLTNVKPITKLVVNQKTKAVVPDEKPEKWRMLPKGEIGWLVSTNGNLADSFHPHVFIEVAGLPTHLSIKAGGGFVDREQGFALGGFVGKYDRRVDDYGDITYKAKQFESRTQFGYYALLDRPYFALYMSQAFEKTHDYTEARATLKLGELVDIGMRGLEVLAETESYLGTGGGLLYRFSMETTALSVGVLYALIGSAEEADQILVNQVISSGGLVRIRLDWY